MEPAYWRERWRAGDTGWEQAEVNGLLARHWGSLRLQAGTRIFVPLCGASIDMDFLAARGHQVFGVEIVPEAIERFLAGRGLAPRRRAHRLGTLYEHGPFTLLAADAFALAAEDLAGCAGFYDRAALVALPAAMRRRYVGEVLGKLPPGSLGLLIALEFPEAARPGPPFPVGEAELGLLFADWRPECLERSDLRARDPGFAAGMAYAWAAAWRLRRPG